MRPTVLLFVASQLLVGLGANAAALPRTAPATTNSGVAAQRPAIEVQQSERDGGVVEQGTVVRYQFTVRNRGQADLQVREVRPSCGCSVARWHSVVKPGATSVIEAQMQTDLFDGPVTKHLTVISNDPEHPQIELTISAQVEPRVWVRPGAAAVLSIADSPMTHGFLLERNGGRPMKILQVSAGAPFVTAEVVPLAGQGRYKVTVTASPTAPYGRSSVPVAVRTDVEHAETITLRITVDKGIVTVPPVLFFGLLPGEIKAPVQAVVTLSRPSRSFHVKGVTVDDAKLAPHLETVREGAEYRVMVTYAGGWNAGLQQKSLTVTTDDPGQPTLQIPVQAVVQAKAADLPSVAPSR